jgi:hypothetical protein
MNIDIHSEVCYNEDNMNREKYIEEQVRYLLDNVLVDGDDLDEHLIAILLEEVYQAGIDEGKGQKNVQMGPKE